MSENRKEIDPQLLDIDAELAAINDMKQELLSQFQRTGSSGGYEARKVVAMSAQAYSDLLREQRALLELK